MKLLPLLPLLSCGVASASVLRGAKATTTSDTTTSSVAGPFTCSFSAFDSASCTSTLDDTGADCVWCELNGNGICVTADQSATMEQVVPQLQCSSSSPSSITATATVPADFFACLDNHVEGACEDASCTWCLVGSRFGVCLANPAALAVKDCSFFDCDPIPPSPPAIVDNLDAAQKDVIVANPLDIACLAAGMGSDDAQSVCDATLDSEGAPCVWCNAAGVFGLCLSGDQAAEAGQYLTCDNQDIVDFPTIPEDIAACLKNTHMDGCQKANSCTWCDTVAGFGICFTDDLAEVANEHQPFFDCSLKEEDDHDMIQSPYDIRCVTAGLKDGAEDACHDTQDGEGSPCVWCQGRQSPMSICLSADQAQMAGQWLTCENTEAETTVKDTIQSPYDTTCVTSGFQGDNAEESCHGAQDDEGSPCMWCQGPESTMGVCLSADQAQVAGQWLTCENTEAETAVKDKIQSPYDTTCMTSGFQGDNAEESCHGAQDDEGSPCVWCQGPESTMGVCLSADQAQVAGQWLTCEPNFADTVTVAKIS